MLNVLLWALIGVGTGFLAFALGPVILGMAAGHGARDKIGNWYLSLAQTAMGDAAIVAREQGGVSLTSISYDPKFQADKASVDGATGHIVDDFGDKSRLKNKPFGLSLESHPVYISPLKAELADAMARAKDDDRLGIQPDGGMRLDLELPAASKLPTLRDAHRFLAGDCKRRYGELAESWTKKSQEGYHDRITLGETMLIIIAFAVGCVMGWFVLSYGDTSGGGGISIPVGGMLAILAIPADLTRRRRRQLQYLTAGIVAVGLTGAITVSVALYYGIIAGIAFFVSAALTATLPWGMIRLAGSATPAGGLIAKGLWVLAQLTMGRSGLVRADTGHYEYHPLEERDDGTLFVEMDDGDIVEIDGDEGDLYRFAWRPMAVTEQKSERNLGAYTVEEPEIAEKGTRDERQNYEIHHPKQYGRDSWLLSASRLKNIARGSAGSKLVRNGRNKALEEQGGTQQLDPLWTMLIASAMLILGFILSYLALGGLG